jgi:3-hydroxybutyryl-CoA dehydrogenase
METINRVGVIGAGAMGNGIAQACAAVGLDAVMIDVQDAAVARGLATIAGSLDRLVRKDKLTAADKDATLARIKGSTSYDELKSCDVIIEAATENLELKLKIVRQVDALAKPGCVARLEHVVDLDHAAGRPSPRGRTRFSACISSTRCR